MQQPGLWGGNAVPPADPQLTKQLRRDYNYIGLIMLLLVVGKKYAFRLLIYFLVFIRALTPEQMNVSQLGLSNTLYLVVYAVANILMMGIPAVVATLCCGRRHFPLSPAKACRGGAAFFGILFAVGGCMAANVITNILLVILSQYNIPIPETPQLMENTPTSLLMGIIVMAVLPALLEEMVFRGYILRALRPYGDWYAVVLSSVLFALIHGNIRQIPFALIVGLLLGWLYTSTDNIWLPVAVHFANNATSTLLQYFGFTMTDSQAALCFLFLIFALCIIGGVAAVILCVRYKELFFRPWGATSLTAGGKVGNLFLAPVLIVAFLALFYMTYVGTFYV